MASDTGNHTSAAFKEIQKIVGKKYDVKRMASSLKATNDAIDEFGKAVRTFKSMREPMRKTFQEIEGANLKIVAALRQLNGQADKADFGLDDSGDDKDKIKKCRELLSKAIAQDIKDSDKQNKDIAELDKHISHISDYDPAT